MKKKSRRRYDHLVERNFDMPKKPTNHASSPQKSVEAPFDFDPREIKLKKLLVDPNNDRFFDRKKFKKKAFSRFHEKSVQRAALETLEQSYQLDELKQSILKNGSYRVSVLHDPQIPRLRQSRP